MRGETGSAHYNLASRGVDVDTGGTRGHVEVTRTGVGNGCVKLDREGGVRGGVGIHIEVIRAELVKTVFKLMLGASICQVRVYTRLDRKYSQSLLMTLPGPSG